MKWVDIDCWEPEFSVDEETQKNKMEEGKEDVWRDGLELEALVWTMILK